MAGKYIKQVLTKIKTKENNRAACPAERIDKSYTRFDQHEASPQQMQMS